MNRLLLVLMLFATLIFSNPVRAQQSQDFGTYVVHYNALNTNLIPPQVAQGYGIVRSSSRALLNVTVLKKVMDTPGTPANASVKASATNLTGQLRELAFRELNDSEGAVYYIAEFPVHNMETYRFEITVAITGEEDPLIVRFTQQFYTE